ncbi:hypothetical protein Tco_0851797 [Tanacetum coccineum]
MDHYIKKALWIYYIRGDDEVMDEEFSDNEVAKTYLLRTLRDSRLKKNIRMIGSMNGTEIWNNDGYYNGGNLRGAYIVGNSLHYQDLEWYDALKDNKLKEETLRNKAIMEGLIDEDDESGNNGWRRWDGCEITDHDQEDKEYENEHKDEERCEFFDHHELPVCNIKRFEMINFSFRQDKEYVAIKEDEYEDLTNTSKDACRAYQEIFRIMNEGWMCFPRDNPESYSEASHINNSIPRKEKDPGSFTLPCFINNVCFDNSLVDLGASISFMSLSTYLNLGLGELAHTKLIVELADMTVKYPKGIAENVLVGIGKFVFPVDFIILDMPEDIKMPLILGRPFLSTARSKINVYKRKITLRVGEERIIFTSVKPASSLIKRVYMLSLRERMELDLEARLIGETLLRRNQGDDLMPTIEEGEVIEEFKTRDDELDTGINDYPRPRERNIDKYWWRIYKSRDLEVLES